MYFEHDAPSGAALMPVNQDFKRRRRVANREGAPGMTYSGERMLKRAADRSSLPPKDQGEVGIRQWHRADKRAL